MTEFKNAVETKIETLVIKKNILIEELEKTSKLVGEDLNEKPQEFFINFKN